MALIKTQTDSHARECYHGKDPEALEAASNHVRNAIEDADTHDEEGAPLWFGWALHRAFLAGVRFEQLRKKSA